MVAPLRLALESSFLAAGSAGFPARGGFLLSYRPNYFLGVGLHLDTNFTDHLSGTARLEGLWPAHRYFHLEGAVEVGARAFFGQNQTFGDRTLPLSGAVFTFGAEVAATIPFSDFVGISAFGRFLYSPGGGLSETLAAGQSGPTHGVSWNGGEVLVGLRLEFYPPVGRPHRVEPVESEPPRPRVEAEPSTTPRDTLRDFEATVERMLAETPEAPAVDAGTAADGGSSGGTAAIPDAAGGTDSSASRRDAGSVPASDGAADTPRTDASAPEGGDAAAHADAAVAPPPREEILALQRELHALTGSVSSLETEIEAAIQILNDLSVAQEAGQPLHIRLDRLYDSIHERPAHLDLAELNNFLAEFRQTLHDSDPLRLLIQSSTEAFGPAILSNLRAFATELASYQRSLPARSRPELDASVAQLGALLEEIQSLRNRPETTEPPASQVSLWRVRMERIRTHVAELEPSLSAEQVQSLNDLVQRLQSGFDNLTARLDETRRNWLVTRALFSHYEDFRAARRPAQAVAALRGIMTELEGAPASYRRLRQRNLASLRNVLEEFIDRRSARPAANWSEARDLAIAAMHWIDPSYTPPPLAEATTSRRGHGSHRDGSDGSPTFRFPAGGATGGGRREE